MNLRGKVALLTGASRGISKAIAERLGRDGASVVVNYYVNRPGVDERARRRGRLGYRKERWRGIGCRGQCGRCRCPAVLAQRELTNDDFDLVFNTNARATFIAMHEAATRLRDGGRVVAISAGFSLMPRPGTVPTGE
jgi:3-oxoacyl-[acyl-carrier protein] reductase